MSKLNLRRKEWPDLLAIMQSAINNIPLQQRAGTPTVRPMTNMKSIPPMSTLYRARASKPVTISDVSFEHLLYVERLGALVGELHPVIQDAVRENRQRAGNQAPKGKLPNFVEVDFVHVAWDTFHVAEQLCFRFHDPHHVFRALNDFVFYSENIWQ